MKRRILSAIAAVFTAIALTACGTVSDKAYTYDGSTGTYSGDWKSGKPEGTGTYSYADGTITATISGDWKNGKPEGQVTYKYSDSEGSSYYYSGAFSMGNPEGKGHLELSSDGISVIYEGDFVNGSMSGSGNINVKSDGATFVYEGTFANDDFCNGSYVSYNADGSVAEKGTYENGEKKTTGDKFVEDAIHAADGYLGAGGLLDSLWDMLS